MEEKKLRKIWCQPCKSKKPPTISEAAFLVPFRENWYDLLPNGFDRDKRVFGVCSQCIGEMDKFRRENASVVDKTNPNIVYRKVF